MIYKTERENEIKINNRILSREYLIEIKEYKNNVTKLTENETGNKQNLEKKLIKK